MSNLSSILAKTLASAVVTTAALSGGAIASCGAVSCAPKRAAKSGACAAKGGACAAKCGASCNANAAKVKAKATCGAKCGACAAKAGGCAAR